jgi:hypothetical protein
MASKWQVTSQTVIEKPVGRIKVLTTKNIMAYNSTYENKRYELSALFK